MSRFFILVACLAFLCNNQCNDYDIPSTGSVEALNSINIRSEISNLFVLDADFEDGSTGSWDINLADESQYYWDIEDVLSPFEPTNPAPVSKKKVSQRHLRVKRSSGLAFGVAVVRSSEFMASPGDSISFSYWIQSKHKQFNNLQVDLNIFSPSCLD